MSAFRDEQTALATYVPEGVIAVGETLPNRELWDPRGAVIKLDAALDGRRSVIVFYRGVWCPYCNIALHAYQSQLLPELERRAVGLIAVSPQTPDGSLSMREKQELRFAVLSDPGNALASSAGIDISPSEATRAAQLELGLDLTAANADGTTVIPMPTTVILDPDRTVRWIDVHPDYTTRSEPGEILTALGRLS
jgi:peroxiredoxin